MSDEVNVLSRTQQINVEQSSAAVSVINAGPQGPSGDSTMAGPPGPAGPPGTSGTTILDGTGPPSPALGAVDDYYLDTTNRILYGPKNPPPTESPLTIAGSISGNVASAGGVRVRFEYGGLLSKLRYTRQATSSDTITFRVWDDTSTQLSTVADTRPGQAGTFDVTLPTPLVIAAGDVRRIVYESGVANGVAYNSSTQAVTNTATMTFISFVSQSAGFFPSTIPPFSFYVSPLFASTSAPLWPVGINATSELISGAGIPAGTVGIDGQYYLDTTGKVFYGPRSTVTATSEVFGFTDGGTTSTTSNLELGSKVTINRAGYITGVRYKRIAANASSFVCTLYNVSPGTEGTILATVTDTHASGVGWFTATFGTPVAVSVGQVVVASICYVTTANSPTPTLGTVASNPASGSMTFVDGRSHSGGAGYPNSLLAAQYISPVWTASLTTTGLWTPIIDPRYGVRVAWENDSASFGSATSEQTLASYLLVNPNPGTPPGGLKWVFTLHGLCSNTGAAPINLTLRIKVNGTTALGTSTVSVPNGTGERIFEVEWTLLGDNDWNLNQKAKFRISGLLSPPTTTDDLLNRFGYTRGGSIVSATWDDPMLLEITGQFSSSATQTLDMHGWDVIRYLTTPG